MFYEFIKLIARAAFRFYCRSLLINKKEILKCEGPILLASNHPNSFLDAIILCTLFDKPVYSLARGDAFKTPLLSKILHALKMLPVYRVSEGVENLEENYKTFEDCKDIFRLKGIVLIFSEGRCVNEWHLRPLKKGTARLALSSWEDGIPLQVLPVALNYHSFRKFGKNLRFYFGNFISRDKLEIASTYGKSVQQFNLLLQQQLQPNVFEINPDDKDALHKKFFVPQPFLKRLLLFIPAIVGWLLHAPLYIAVRTYVTKKIKSTDHFDSLIIAILFLAYPVYLVVVTAVILLVTANWYSLLLLAVLPFTAWSLLQVKGQMD